MVGALQMWDRLNCLNNMNNVTDGEQNVGCWFVNKLLLWFVFNCSSHTEDPSRWDSISFNATWLID